MSFDPDELVHPSWLDGQFFEKIFKNSESDGKLKIISFDVAPAAKMGDHYASTMFRVKVVFISKGQKKLKSVIVITKPEIDGFKKDILDSSPIFDIEMKMYGKMVAEMERLLSYIGDATRFGPALLYSSKEPKDVLVFIYVNVGTQCRKSGAYHMKDLEFCLNV